MTGYLRAAHYALIGAVIAFLASFAEWWQTLVVATLVLGVAGTSCLITIAKLKDYLADIHRQAEVIVRDSQARQKRLEVLEMEVATLKERLAR